MTRYRYKAVDGLGRMVDGDIEAANEFDLEQRLEKMSLALVRYDEIRYKRSLFSLRRKLPRRDLINFTLQLEQLVKSGVPIIEALQGLSESDGNTVFKNILYDIIEKIEAGNTLAQALEAHINVFGKVYVFMVRVGEESGQLARVLHELGEMLKWQDEIVARAKAVSVYPAIVFCVIMAVVAFLMLYLVPLLVPFFESNGVQIPIYTKALMMTSQFLESFWYWLLLGFTALLLTVALLNRYSPQFKFWFDQQRLKLWLVGPIDMKIKLSRFTKHLALMYGSGVTVLDGLELSRPVMSNVVLDASVQRAKHLIENGASISDGFSQVGLFPPLMVRMLKVGETSGQLDSSLLTISYFYERDAKELIDRLEPAIMPMLTGFLGGLMLWIMASVLFPIYEALGKITA